MNCLQSDPIINCRLLRLLYLYVVKQSVELGDQLNHNRLWNTLSKLAKSDIQMSKRLIFWCKVIINGCWHSIVLSKKILLVYCEPFLESWFIEKPPLHWVSSRLPHCYRSLALHVDNPVHVPNHQLMFGTPALVTWKSIVLIRVIIWTLLSYPIRHDCVMIQRSAPTRAVHLSVIWVLRQGTGWGAPLEVSVKSAPQF